MNCATARSTSMAPARASSTWMDRSIEEQIERFAGFGREYANPDGGTERGLNAKEIKTFMAENLKRDGDKARWTYPIMMQGEWPVLLDILGKGEGEARYLSVADVRTLFVDRKLPKRITDRLPAPSAWRGHGSRRGCRAPHHDVISDRPHPSSGSSPVSKDEPRSPT